MPIFGHKQYNGDGYNDGGGGNTSVMYIMKMVTMVVVELLSMYLETIMMVIICKMIMVMMIVMAKISVTYIYRRQ